ncbi:MAG: GtrA family protein, partial [Christensenellales bacterium]
MSGEKRKKELKDGIVQLVKYNIVGVINTLVDFLVYQLLTYLGMKYAIAQCISYSCGILNSYFFNSRWTFKRDSGRSKKEFIYFVAVNLVSMGLSVLLLKVCYEILNINSNIIS